MPRIHEVVVEMQVLSRTKLTGSDGGGAERDEWFVLMS